MLDSVRMQLREALAVDRVLTRAQLERRGWFEAARPLGLSWVTYSCRTRVNQSDSDRLLTFFGLDREVLSLPPRELMHLAGLAEVRSRLTLQPGEEWRHVTLSGNLRLRLPDAEVVQVGAELDAAVELDTGYDRQRRLAKLRGFGVAGYRRIIWATSVHGRVVQVAREMTELHRKGELPQVVSGEVVFVDFWSSRDPYVGRSRCHKPFRAGAEFSAQAG